MQLSAVSGDLREYIMCRVSKEASGEEMVESFSSNYGDVTPNELREAVEGKELTHVSNLVEEIVGSEVSVRGRVHKNRLVSNKLFVILRESGFTVQCVLEQTRVGANMIKFVKQLSRESIVELIGLVSHRNHSAGCSFFFL